MILGSMVFTVSTAEAKTSSAAAASAVETNLAPQWQRNRRGNQRIVRTYVRNVRRGRAIYRETYRVVTNRNGRTRATLISRIRIR